MQNMPKSFSSKLLIFVSTYNVLLTKFWYTSSGNPLVDGMTTSRINFIYRSDIRLPFSELVDTAKFGWIQRLVIHQRIEMAVAMPIVHIDPRKKMKGKAEKEHSVSRNTNTTEHIDSNEFG